MISKEQYEQMFSSDFPVSYDQFAQLIANKRKKLQQTLYPSISHSNKYTGTATKYRGLSKINYTDYGTPMSLIKKYFPQSEWQKAYNVMMGESGGRIGAIGDTNTPYASYGLFQIRALPGRPSPGQLLNPEFNVQYAVNLWRNQGWRPWTVARKLGYV